MSTCILLTAATLFGSPQPATAELSAARQAELAALLTERPLSFGRPHTDRAAWAKLAKHPAYSSVVASAQRLLTAPVPDLPDDLYLDFSKTGNRTRWQAVNGQRSKFLTPLVLGECLEDKGRFVPKLEEVLRAFCGEKTWVMPAHDRGLANFKGTTVDIDLKSSARGWELATTLWLVGDKLTPEVRTLVEENLQRRIIRPYRDMVTGKRKGNWWLTCTNNWNAVCLAGVTGTALALLESRDERALFVTAAEHYSEYFLKGFTPDGYCSEGVGYWNYGFGNYLNLSEIIYQATDGKFDLMARPEVRAPATFGARIGILGAVCPAFADCSITARPGAREMWYVSRKYRLGLRQWEQDDPVSPSGALFSVLLYSFPNSASKTPPADTAAGGPALRDWFSDAGILICRPGPNADCLLGAAFKGGHNGEHHNHNDVGSYVVVVDDSPVLLDPGGETYTARTFSSRRYESKLLNSFGHPVPLVAGQLQSTGSGARAKVVRTDFSPEQDTLLLDLKGAYKVKELTRLERQFRYHRSGAGWVSVRDEVEFTSPQTFGTALLTLGQWEQTSPQSLTIRDFEVGLRVDIQCGGGELAIEATRIEEEARAKPTRLGLNFKAPVTKAFIELTLTPLDLWDGKVGLPNGGFESGVLGWQIPGDGFGSLSTEQAASGKTSLKISDGDKARGSNLSSARVRFAGAAKYELRGKYFGQSGEGVGLYVRYLDSRGRTLNVRPDGNMTSVGTLGGADQQWRSFAFPFVTPAETARLQVWIHSYNGAVVEGYLDDLQIVPAQ